MVSTRKSPRHSNDTPPAKRARTASGETRSRGSGGSKRPKRVAGSQGPSSSPPKPTAPVAEGHHGGGPASTPTRPAVVGSQAEAGPQPETPKAQTTPGTRNASSSDRSSDVNKNERVVARAEAVTRTTLNLGTDEDGNMVTENVHLQLRLVVHTCYIPFQTRLGYTGHICLRRPEGVYKSIGIIEAWRVSKPTAANPNINPRYWIQDWLRTRLDSHSEDGGGWNELAMALRALYRQDGLARSGVHERPTFSDEGDELVFIQLLHILWKDSGDGTTYQGNGFGPKALEMFYRLLTSRLLPAWFNVPTPAKFILVPGIPEGNMAASWDSTLLPGETTDSVEYFDRVEGTLRAMYQRWGYNILEQDVQVTYDVEGNKTPITVLGRRFPDPVPSEPRDRVLGGETVDLLKLLSPSMPSSSPMASSPMRHRRLAISSGSS